jgi:hypothetical protein
VAAAAVVAVGPAGAQVVKLAPACGKVGDGFHIGGSGWPEPPPPCTYTFFFDGKDFGVPPQPDGLFGPPDASGSVPNVMKGKYPVRIDLRLNDDGSLQGSGSADFCVVDATAASLTATAAGTDGIDITYAPSCKNKCTKIMFIQTVNELGTKDDDSTALALPSTWGVGPVSQDSDYGAMPGTNAVRVDRLNGRTQPYYGGDGAGLGNQTMGMSDGCVQTNATMHDRPGQPDDAYPAGFKKLTLNFTSHAFCVSGDDAGMYYGDIGWVWMKTKGATPSVSIGAGNPGAAPDAAASNAVNTWATNHGFNLPAPSP